MTQSNPCLHALLLLPSPPQSTDLLDLSLAFSPPLASSILKLSRLHRIASSSSSFSSNPTGACPALLDIALPLYPPAHTFQPRPPIFNSAQTLLSGTYSLLQELHDGNVTLSSGLANPFAIPVPPSGPGSIDTRIILTHETGSSPHSYATTSLHTLATSQRPWTHIFHVDSPPGEHLHRNFTRLAHSSLHARLSPPWISERVPGGIQMLNPSLPPMTFPSAKTYTDALVCIDLHGRLEDETMHSQAALPFREKYLLTMALSTLTPPSSGDWERRTLFLAIEHDVAPRFHLVRTFLTALLDFPEGRVSATSATVRAGSGVRSLHSILDLRRGDGLRCLLAGKEFFVEGGLIEDVGVLVVEFEDGWSVGEVGSLRAEKGWGTVEVVSVGGLSGGATGDVEEEEEEEEWEGAE